MGTGVRFRDLDGTSHEFALDNGRFGLPSSDVDDWIDVRSGFAVNGLVDAHAHLTGASVETMVEGLADVELAMAGHAAQQLEGGVLLIADKGARDDSGLAALDIDPSHRPEIRLAGTVVSTEGGYYPDFGLVVDPDGPVANWIDAVAVEAVSWVKLIGDWPRKGKGPVTNFTEGALRAIVDVAHRRGKRVAIHAAAPATSTLAVAAGVDSIEHGLFLTEDDLRALGRRGGTWVPTIAAMEGIRDMLGHDSSGGRLFVEGLNNVRELLGSAIGFGVTVLGGTDLHLPHGQVATEGQRLVDYGLDVETALTAVTDAGYHHLGVERSFSVGAIADVVVLRGDPRDDLSLLGDPLVVVRAGRVVKR